MTLNWKTLAIGLGLVVLVAQPALAQDLSPLTAMLTNLVTALTGPVGKAIAILAVVAAGYMMFTGRLNWPLFLAIFVGVVLVFSASTIVAGFATN